MPVAINEDVIISLSTLRNEEENHKAPGSKPKIDHKNWLKTSEAIVEYLSKTLGCTKIPLAYVVRDDEDVPLHRREMIRRAPHGTPTNRVDKEQCLAFYVTE